MTYLNLKFFLCSWWISLCQFSHPDLLSLISTWYFYWNFWELPVNQRNFCCKWNLKRKPNYKCHLFQINIHNKKYACSVIKYEIFLSFDFYIHGRTGYQKCKHSNRKICLHSFSFSVFLFVCFWERISLHSSGCHGIHCVDQVGLEITEIHLYQRWD